MKQILYFQMFLEMELTIIFAHWKKILPVLNHFTSYHFCHLNIPIKYFPHDLPYLFLLKEKS